MFTIPQEITQRFEEPERAQETIAACYQQLTEAAQEEFTTKTLAMLQVARAAPQKISKAALEIELEAILESLAARPIAQPKGTIGHGSALDLSDCFDDLESTFFDPPSG